MERKPLVGISICAVVLLILCSLSNVVGYQSVRSTAVNDSPLFKTRTQRATNQQQNILTSRYLGMGNGNLLQFPMKDNNIGLLKRTIESISQMNSKKFIQFTKLCIQKIKQKNILKDTNPKEIVYALHMLKKNPETIIKSIINNENYNLTSSGAKTLCNWFPFCIILFIGSTLLLIIALIGLEIMSLLTIGATGDC